MKMTRSALFALLLLGSTAAVASAQTSISAGISFGPSGRASVDLGFFYDNLASYGNWIQRPSYGWVWTPREVSTSWRPYQDGHWVWTDQGWTWISDEPYGWATYHYGRWYDDPEIGWSWVPGNEWAPAWVSWQEGGDYVGWAALPPSFDINVSYNNGGYGGYGGYGIGPEAYVFVPERYILAPSIATYVISQQEVVTILPRTHGYTNYRHEGDRIFNQGVPIDHVQRAVGRTIPRYQLADLQGGYQRGGRGARIQGNRVEIFRPQVQNVRVAPPANRAAARNAVVSAQQFQSAHPNRATQFQQRDRQTYGQGTQGQRLQGYPQGQPGQGRADRQQRPYSNPNAQNPRVQGSTPYYPADRQTQQQDRANRQRQYDAQRQQQQQQQDQANRQRQYDNRQRYQNPGQTDQQRPPQTDQRQYQQDRQRQQQDQANRQRQNDQQRPPQADQRQQPPPNRNGDNRGQSDNNQRRQDRQQRQKEKDRQQNQDDNNRPPA